MKNLNKLKLLLAVLISAFCYSTTNAQCTASFTSINNGNGNYSFTNTSTGSFLSYYWTFGDGNNSYSYNPSNSYLNNGAYEVCLTIFDSITSCQSTFCDSVFITTLPCSLNQPQYFDSLCNWNFFANNTGSNYYWDFGDGTSSNQKDPIHGYTNIGWYYLCLTVDSCTPICDSIYVGCTVSGIENATNNLSKLNVYPNPVKNNLTIALNLNESAHVRVFVTDILGNEVAQINNQELNSGANTLKWNSNNLSNGIYLLNIETKNALQVEKLILN